MVISNTRKISPPLLVDRPIIVFFTAELMVIFKTSCIGGFVVDITVIFKLWDVDGTAVLLF
jgi:hypothetical protein